MNNKGFAITSIIYGLMILFVMVVSSFLSILVGRMRRMDELIEGVYDTVKYEKILVNESDFDNETKTFVTNKKGLYNIDNRCEVYLPKDVVIIRGETKSSNDIDQDKYFYNFGGNEDLDKYTEIKCNH